MKKYENCPICEGTSFVNVLDCKDYTVSKKEFSITECDSCKFWFTNPIPKEGDIGSFYESEDYISHSNIKKGITNRIYQRVRKITLKEKLKLIQKESKGKNILDIGCGTGEFLNQCKSANFNCLGIEPSTVAKEYAIKNYGLNIKEEEYISEIKDKSIDVISMWHVLEHVYHLNKRIEEMHRILKDNGVIVVAVPNCNSYDAKYYQEYWAAYDLPRHLYHFKPKDIKRIFGKYDFELSKILPMKFDSYYVSMLSEKYKTGNSKIFKALIKGFQSNQKAKQAETPKYSSQIYILRKSI